MPQITRRAFAKSGAAALAAGATLAHAQAQPTQTPSERIRLGFIGAGNRGQKLMRAFQEHQDAEIVALCDVDQRSLAQAMRDTDNNPDTATDFRRIIDRSDIDAVVVATPDHWHAIQTVSACDALKDVYVEMPLRRKRRKREKGDAALFRRPPSQATVGYSKRAASPFLLFCSPFSAPCP